MASINRRILPGCWNTKTATIWWSGHGQNSRKPARIAIWPTGSTINLPPVTQFNIEDLTSGFRLVRLSVARQFIYLLPNTFSYPSTLTLGYLRSGRSVKYVPIQTRARVGNSKIKLLKDGTRFFLIITKIASLFSPFRVFLPISFVLFVTGIFYYGYTYLSQGRFTNMSALLFNSSIIIFMIGLVAEQISQMRYDRVE